MKTKKISWQAIAIVVLALVLIASIALGVSGAWFQDKDAESQEVTTGAPVLIKLADKTSGGDVEKFGNVYQASTKAYPGDFVLGATKVMAASDTATIYRAKIVTSVQKGGVDVTSAKATEENYNAFKAGYTGDYTDWTGTNPDGTVVYTDEEIGFNLYIINNMLKNLENTNWIAGTDGYIYYHEVSTAAEIVLFENGLSLSEELTNACNGWTISVSLEVEGIQAANADTAGHPWNTELAKTELSALYGSSSDGKTTTVCGYNASRKA